MFPSRTASSILHLLVGASVYSTGIDQHRGSSVLTTYTESGELVGHGTIPNEPARWRGYFAQFPGAHRAVVEATGRWYWLGDLLRGEGVDLRLAHAKFLKAIGYAKVKTDAVDARTLGQLLRTDFIPEAHMISDELRGPRDVLRARLRLVQRCTSCQNSVDRLLEKFNVDSVAALPRHCTRPRRRYTRPRSGSSRTTSGSWSD